MLSTGQPPHPVSEVDWHANQWATTGEATSFATTYLLSGLKRGQSIVAFYGSADLDNCLLGLGVFAGFERVDSDTGKKLKASISLYAESGLPRGTKGFVKVRDFNAMKPSKSIDSLAGFIEASRLPLTLENLPVGPARAQIYYRRAKE